jgi:hypothetical protein
MYPSPRQVHGRPPWGQGTARGPIVLLNARWRTFAPRRCCAACGEHIPVDARIVRSGGELFHNRCAGFGAPRP